MAMTKEDLLNEISKAMDSNPDMYIGDLLEFVVERQHATRKVYAPYYSRKDGSMFPITNHLLYDSLVRYNKYRQGR